MHDLQIEELLEGIEVAVAVEQCVVVLDAERGDEAVDGLPIGLASRAESSVVARRGGRESDPAGLEELEPAQVAEDAVVAGGLVEPTGRRREPQAAGRIRVRRS